MLMASPSVGVNVKETAVTGDMYRKITVDGIQSIVA